MAATYAVKCQCAEIKICTEEELQDALKICPICGALPQARVKLAVEDTYPWKKTN
ncbi:hypothetical protein UFOVP221_72 [uncultured Caudovirales phage]|uniref:Uncharacterized protein n=1 Tax=uncultured Caudovirales phage TaxID=2100421 RepID=A0A6J7WNS5_9CAUD|nr:hypothetical protein UFOVP221_72 [uncultured Caudovirales phage]